MAYQANRGDDYDASQSYSDQKKAEDARNSANNANTIRNAADVAMASKNPYAMAAGAAVKAADKLTGGKSTEMLGKGMTKANKMAPGGRSIQNASNKLAESGMGDKIGTAASMKSGGGAGAANGAAKAGEAADKAQKAQSAAENAQKAKTAADNAQKVQDASNKAGKAADTADTMKGGRGGSPSSGGAKDDATAGGDEEEKKTKGIGSFLLKQTINLRLRLYYLLFW